MEELRKVDILANNLTKSGYGERYETIRDILLKLTEDDIEKLTYNLYRTAEKCGMDAFDCDELFEW